MGNYRKSLIIFLFLYIWDKAIAMNQEELSPLQTEIAVLQKIIRVLLEQNDALKAENSWLKQQITANNPTHSQTYTDFELSNSIHSPTDTALEASETTHSTTQLTNTADETLHSPTENDVAPDKSTEHQSELNLGVSDLASSNPESGSGVNQNIYTLPVRLEVSGQNTGRLASILLHAGVGNGKHSTALTAAALLIHFYNEQPGEYKYLKRLTSYSDGGLAKMLMMLRRKGYLIKSGFQQHAVAANGIKALQQAKCN